MKELAESAKSALEKLKLRCFDWDCSAGNLNKQYEEYCTVVAALKDTFRYLNNAQNRVRIFCYQNRESRKPYKFSQDYNFRANSRREIKMRENPPKNMCSKDLRENKSVRTY